MVRISAYSQADENRRLDIFSNQFQVLGNMIGAFPPGFTFDVVGGPNRGTYTTLYADINGAYTMVRPVQDIRASGFRNDRIIPHQFGLYQTEDTNTSFPSTEARVKVIDRIVFSGIGESIRDDVIAYDLENSDSMWYELPASTIVQSTEPGIYSGPTAPLPTWNPNLEGYDGPPGFGNIFDDTLWTADHLPDGLLWYNTISGTMHICLNDKWRLISVIYWMKTDSSGNYIQLYRRVKNSFVDTGWIPDSFGGYDKISSAITTRFKIWSATATRIMVNGNAVSAVGSQIVPMSIITGPNGVPTSSSIQCISASYVPVDNTTAIDVSGLDPRPYVGGEISISMMNAFAYRFGSQPGSVFHQNVTTPTGNYSYVDEQADVDSVVLFLNEGNFTDRFIGGLRFNIACSVPTGGLELIEDVSVGWFPITTVELYSSTITIDLGTNLIKNNFPSQCLIFIRDASGSTRAASGSAVFTTGHEARITIPSGISRNDVSVFAGVFEPLRMRTILYLGPVFQPGFSVRSVYYVMPNRKTEVITKTPGTSPGKDSAGTSITDEIVFTWDS